MLHQKRPLDFSGGLCVCKIFGCLGERGESAGQGITPARSCLQRGDYSSSKLPAERGLLQLEVACVEAVVESLITDELVVGASLNDSALVKHHNYVGVLDC